MKANGHGKRFSCLMDGKTVMHSLSLVYGATRTSNNWMIYFYTKCNLKTYSFSTVLKLYPKWKNSIFSQGHVYGLIIPRVPVAGVYPLVLWAL